MQTKLVLHFFTLQVHFPCNAMENVVSLYNKLTFLLFMQIANDIEMTPFPTRTLLNNAEIENVQHQVITKSSLPRLSVPSVGRMIKGVVGLAVGVSVAATGYAFFSTRKDGGAQENGLCPEGYNEVSDNKVLTIKYDCDENGEIDFYEHYFVGLKGNYQFCFGDKDNNGICDDLNAVVHCNTFDKSRFDYQVCAGDPIQGNFNHKINCYNKDNHSLGVQFQVENCDNQATQKSIISKGNISI